MPFAENENVRIHYVVEGNGPPLVLQHGFGSDHRAWEFYGYVEALAGNYQVIRIDARGHGASDKPHEPEAYELSRRAGDVVAVLDALGIEQAHYCGYSMGGWIGFGMVQYAPQRLLSLAAGGVHPFADDRWSAFDGVDGTDGAEFIAALERLVGERFPREARAKTLDNDLVALAASTQARSAPAEALLQIEVPVLFYCGQRDVRLPLVQQCAEQVPGAKLAVIPGTGHVTTFVRSNLVLPHLKEHLAAAL